MIQIVVLLKISVQLVLLGSHIWFDIDHLSDIYSIDKANVYKYSRFRRAEDFGISIPQSLSDGINMKNKLSTLMLAGGLMFSGFASAATYQLCSTSGCRMGGSAIA